MNYSQQDDAYDDDDYDQDFDDLDVEDLGEAGGAGQVSGGHGAPTTVSQAGTGVGGGGSGVGGGVMGGGTGIGIGIVEDLKERPLSALERELAELEAGNDELDRELGTVHSSAW